MLHVKAGETKRLDASHSDWVYDELVLENDATLLDLNSCLAEPHESCLLPFEIVRIDPDTMTTEVVIQQEGPPMGVGTVAVQYQDQLLIGSFLGDRMILVPYAGAAN